MASLSETLMHGQYCVSCLFIDRNSLLVIANVKSWMTQREIRKYLSVYRPAHAPWIDWLIFTAAVVLLIELAAVKITLIIGTYVDFPYVHRDRERDKEREKPRQLYPEILDIPHDARDCGILSWRPLFIQQFSSIKVSLGKLRDTFVI